jgi:hypothetical protein
MILPRGQCFAIPAMIGVFPRPVAATMRHEFVIFRAGWLDSKESEGFGECMNLVVTEFHYLNHNKADSTIRPTQLTRNNT